MIPFHKQTDSKKQAGQVVLCACNGRFKNQCPGEWEPGCDLGANEKYAVVCETTLHQYIERKLKTYGE